MLSAIGHLPMNPLLAGQAELLPPIAYSQNGQQLTLILPWAPRDDRSHMAPVPLIVFVQGSGWTTPNLNYELPMLCGYAQEGIAVATVSHRSTAAGHPFPAYLQDVQCAIRFLRAHAARYGIDPERVAAFGTSSGGNTVCLLGLTGDDPRYRTEEYADQSDRVCGVVSCFGPMDLVTLFEERKKAGDVSARMTLLLGPRQEEWPDKLREFSPYHRVVNGQEYPPFHLLHGTGDPLVPHAQMERMFERLRAAGANAQAYYVDGAEHEGNFWSPEVRDVIHDALLQALAVNPR